MSYIRNLEKIKKIFLILRNFILGNSLEGLWLGLHVLIAEGCCSIPTWGTKIL